MKELLKKIKTQLSESLELFKTQKPEDALAKIEEVAETLKEAEAEVERTETPEEMEKIQKAHMEKTIDALLWSEKMKKWAELYASNETVAKLLEDLKQSFTSQMVKVKEELEKTISELPKWSKQVTKIAWGEGSGWSEGTEGMFSDLFPTQE